MPVKVWSSVGGELYSEILTNWDVVVTAEERREEAEELDRYFDEVLDDAADSVAAVESAFKRAHIIGMRFRRHNLFGHDQLKGEPRRFIWSALTQKCRFGARSDGRVEPRWETLIPPKRAKPVVRDAKELPYFEMCDWLAADSLEDAEFIFGGQISHAWQMLDRASLRTPEIRNALKVWLNSQDNENRQRLMERKAYREMMKALRSRWPDRGPGSARRPIHMDSDELQEEVAKVLDSVADRVL